MLSATTTPYARVHSGHLSESYEAHLSDFDIVRVPVL